MFIIPKEAYTIQWALFVVTNIWLEIGTIHVYYNPIYWLIESELYANCSILKIEINLIMKICWTYFTDLWESDPDFLNVWAIILTSF